MRKAAAALARVNDLRRVKDLALTLVPRFGGPNSVADVRRRGFEAAKQHHPGGCVQWYYA